MSTQATALYTAKSAWALLPLHERDDVTQRNFTDAPREFWLLEHDPAWLASRLGSPGRSVLLAMKDGDCFCGLFVHDVGLDLGLGEISFGSIPVRRYVLTGGLGEKVASAEDLTQFLRLLGTRIGARGVVFLQGVHDDEPLRLAIDDPAVRRAFFVLPHGPKYQRCRIILEGSYEEYLVSLKAKTRSDLRRTLRNFTGQFGRGISSQVVTSERGVEAMLPELEKLSAKTYQAKMLGLGITPGGVIEQQLRFAARQGMARVHLLRVDGELISFSIGYTHGDTLYAIHRGYDAALAEWAPGIAHNSFILEDLFQSRIRILDMMYGESMYKTKLSNSSHAEQHFYLIPKTTCGLVTWLALKAVACGSETIGAVAGKLADKGAVTKFIRRLVTRKDSD
jgi:hypothetical protein